MTEAPSIHMPKAHYFFLSFFSGVRDDGGFPPNDFQPASQARGAPAGHCGQGAGLGAGEGVLARAGVWAGC